MRALWHCPTCGKKFSRRWNAERHITEVHKTTARPIKLEQDSSYKEEFEVKQNPQEFVSQHRQNASEYRIVIGFPELNNHSWMSRAQMIIDRVIEAYPNDLKIELYNGRSDGYGSLSMDHNKIIGYRGIVCEKCLSIALLEISIGNGHEFVEHRCQVRHIRHCQGIQNRNAIREQLHNEELPMLLSILIKRLERKLEMGRYLFLNHGLPASSIGDFIDLDVKDIGGNVRLGVAIFSGAAPISDSEMKVFFRQSNFHAYNTFRLKAAVGDPIYCEIGIALASIE